MLFDLEMVLVSKCLDGADLRDLESMLSVGKPYVPHPVLKSKHRVDAWDAVESDRVLL